MVLRKSLASVLGAIMMLAGLTVTSQASATELKMATLAPKRSPWGKTFTKWAKHVKKKSKGKKGKK